MLLATCCNLRWNLANSGPNMSKFGDQKPEINLLCHIYPPKNKINLYQWAKERLVPVESSGFYEPSLALLLTN